MEGHTDNIGSPESNKTLSEERAKSVVSAIVAQGIPAERLTHPDTDRINLLLIIIQKKEELKTEGLNL